MPRTEQTEPPRELRGARRLRVRVLAVVLGVRVRGHPRRRAVETATRHAVAQAHGLRRLERALTALPRDAPAAADRPAQAEFQRIPRAGRGKARARWRRGGAAIALLARGGLGQRRAGRLAARLTLLAAAAGAFRLRRLGGRVRQHEQPVQRPERLVVQPGPGGNRIRGGRGGNAVRGSRGGGVVVRGGREQRARRLEDSTSALVVVVGRLRGLHARRARSRGPERRLGSAGASHIPGVRPGRHDAMSSHACAGRGKEDDAPSSRSRFKRLAPNASKKAAHSASDHRGPSAEKFPAELVFDAGLGIFNFCAAAGGAVGDDSGARGRVRREA